MIIGDLQIHSRYSRACSKNITIDNLEKWARIKGVNLLSTGDFQHPLWRKEIDEKLEEDDNGILWTKNKFPFIWGTEVSLMYSQGGKGRRIHHLIFSPNKEVSNQITEALRKRGRLDYDGRPIFGFTSIELVDMMREISKDIEIVPAHAWTPWFSVFGSKSGFDSLEECFQEKSKHIHAIETGMSCYDGKTEVMTKDGWKKFSEVKFSDEICTLDAKTDKIKFQKPIKKFKYHYKGKMYKLKTKRIDLLVTPNHKLLYSPYNFKKEFSFSLKEAKFLFKKSKKFKKSGSWTGENPKHFVIPSVKIKHGSGHYSGFRDKNEKKVPIKPWLKFFGYWLADGFTSEGKNGNYGVYIVSTENKLTSQMRKILESFGYNVYEYKNRGINVIRVRDYQLFSYLRQFGKASQKFIPNDVKSLSKNLIKIFFKYYIKGDGHVYGRGGKGLSATTISKSLRDDLQDIALRMGISAYYKIHNKKGTPITSLPIAKEKGYKQSEDSWVIYFIRQNIHSVAPSYIKKHNYTETWADYNGFVYCLEVPNHVIYVRRNGIPVWWGNSNPADNWRIRQLDNINLVSFSDAHSFWPWRLGREATIFDTKLDSKEILNAIKTGNGIKETIETSTSYGKYHYDGHRKCNIRFHPRESKQYNNICPKCNKPLTLGVLYRIEELADREEGYKPENAKPFKTLIPLTELVAKFLDIKQLGSKTVWNTYNDLIKEFKNEFNILLNVDKENLSKVVNPKLANIIIKNREGRLKIKSGYDSTYGEVVLDDNERIVKQKSLSDF